MSQKTMGGIEIISPNLRLNMPSFHGQINLPHDYHFVNTPDITTSIMGNILMITCRLPGTGELVVNDFATGAQTRLPYYCQF